MFNDVIVYNGKNKFKIFEYQFNQNDLEQAIVNMIFKNENLRYIFGKPTDENRKEMLRRFILPDFYKREEYYLENDEERNKLIKEQMSNHSFYSFYAEALMAYLNYRYLDNELISAVISTKDTLTDQHTGADACMISPKTIVLGEAKFYTNFNQAKHKIIDDFQNKSLNNKVNSLYINANQSKIVKTINSDYYDLSKDEFEKKHILLSGFILHNKQDTYKYEDIDDIKVNECIKNADVIFYHLPIKDKEELIYLIIKKALELIVNESR